MGPVVQQVGHYSFKLIYGLQSPGEGGWKPHSQHPRPCSRMLIKCSKHSNKWLPCPQCGSPHHLSLFLAHQDLPSASCP